MSDTWAMLEWERLRLADDLAALTEGQWALPTRCGDWTVREVAAHVSGLPSPLRAVIGLIAKRGNVDAFIDAVARERAQLPPDALVAELREFATSRRLPPGVSPAGSLLEVLVHGGDIRRATGQEMPDRPAAHLDTALGFAVTSSGPFRGRDRAQGLRLVASDTGWEHGVGAAVEGAAIDVLSAVLGRRDSADALTGPGAHILQERCG